LPGNGWIFLDVRKDLPDLWELFRRSRRDRESERRMKLALKRKLFPFLPGNPLLKVTKLGVLLEIEECREHPCTQIRGCPCAHKDIRAGHLLEVTVDHPDDDRDDEDEVEITCVRSAEWPNLYHGVGEVEVGPIGGHHHEPHTLTLTFCREMGELTRAFLLLRYEVDEKCCKTVRARERGESYAC
jgi:hypothetical protein